MKRVQQLAKTISNEWKNGKTDTLEGLFLKAGICKFCSYSLKEGITYTHKVRKTKEFTTCDAVRIFHETGELNCCDNGIIKYLNEEVEDVT